MYSLYVSYWRSFVFDSTTTTTTQWIVSEIEEKLNGWLIKSINCCWSMNISMGIRWIFLLSWRCEQGSKEDLCRFFSSFNSPIEWKVISFNRTNDDRQSDSEMDIFQGKIIEIYKSLRNLTANQLSRLLLFFFFFMFIRN